MLCQVNSFLCKEKLEREVADRQQKLQDMQQASEEGRIYRGTQEDEGEIAVALPSHIMYSPHGPNLSSAWACAVFPVSYHKLSCAHTAPLSLAMWNRSVSVCM